MKNKKVISTFFVILLILLSSNISFAVTGVVNTPALRIREKASKDSEIITRVYEDEEVEILGEEGDWYKVTANGKTGYASKVLIDKKEEASNTTDQNTVSNYEVENDTPKQEEPKPEVNENTNTSKSVITEDVVARILPNFGSNEAILLTKDTEVEFIRSFNNWTEISVNNRKVWILKSKIKVSENTTPTTQENTPTVENTVAENTVTENTVVENTTTKNTANTSNEVAENNTVSTNTTSNETATITENRNTKGIINVETANVREKASTSSKIVHRLDEDDEVTIVAEEGDFYKITNSEVESGYVAKSLVTVSDVSSRSLTEVRSEENENPIESVASKSTDVVNFAKQYLGVDYVLGGKTPETGFDCSGFTRYVFKNFGFSLGTVAADQNSIGTEIDRSELKEGDLILFYNEENTKIGHTGIYIGNNEFIHAANPERGVVTDNLETNTYYSTRFVTARRIVE